MAAIVEGNLGLLRWHLVGFAHRRVANTRFLQLSLGVCVAWMVLLLIAPLRAAFGFPTALDLRWVLAGLGLPALWVLGGLVAGRPALATR